jgi:GAF domain-containing protein
MEDFTLPTSELPIPEELQAESENMLGEVLLTLKLERAITLIKIEGQWRVGASHEISTNDFWNQAPISLGILEAAVNKREVVVLMDAGSSDEFGGRTSVVLSGLRSVACAPFIGDGGEVLALLYADNRVQTGAFSDDDGEKLQELANEMGRRLTSGL